MLGIRYSILTCISTCIARVNTGPFILLPPHVRLLVTQKPSIRLLSTPPHRLRSLALSSVDRSPPPPCSPLPRIPQSPILVSSLLPKTPKAPSLISAGSRSPARMFSPESYHPPPNSRPINSLPRPYPTLWFGFLPLPPSISPWLGPSRS